jgi:hypothetical protein
MMLLDLDPNVVKPGWTPLLITIGLALVMVLLFRSMRRQFRRVDANFPEPAGAPGAVSILPEPRPSAGDEPTDAADEPRGGGRTPAR